jgi:hypothetical protein
MNASDYNYLQKANLDRSRLKIPLMQTGECLHGVGSFKQSMFPQSIGLSASFDADLVYRVGRAIGTEARSVGVHACFSPVLDLGLDPRWGRLQGKSTLPFSWRGILTDTEAWGEDKILTSKMGVAYSAGLSKNNSLSDPEAVVPIMKVAGFQNNVVRTQLMLFCLALCRAWLTTIRPQRSTIHGTRQPTGFARPHDPIQSSHRPRRRSRYHDVGSGTFVSTIADMNTGLTMSSTISQHPSTQSCTRHSRTGATTASLWPMILVRNQFSHTQQVQRDIKAY